MKKSCFALLLIIFIACKPQQKKLPATPTNLKYAKGFLIEKIEDCRKITILAPYKNASENYEFLLVPKGKKAPPEHNKLKVVHTPLEKMVLTTTAHVPILELLGKENTLVGFPNTNYISSVKTRQLIDAKKITDIGAEYQINVEVLLSLNPELVMSFAVNSPNKSYKAIQKMNIPIMLNGDWLEKTPLARAEWIKLFGALYHEEKKADSIFNHIESEYLAVKKLATAIKNKPTVLSGSIFQGVWNVPAGESFMATYFKDAQTDYLWQDSKGTGSLPLNFEAVYSKANNADLWISAGTYKSKAALNTANIHYKKFKAFQTDQIYSFGNYTGVTGGLYFFELGPMSPHIILKDIVKIAHPEALPNYRPVFFSPLK